MLLPNDILIYETSDGPTVWASQRLIIERCEVSEATLKDTARVRYKQSLPASWQKKAERDEFFLDHKPGKSWRWGRKNGQYYYDVDTIPNRKPSCYRDRLPSKDELIAQVDANRLRGSRERDARYATLLIQTADEFYNQEDVRWLHVVSGMGLDIATCRDYGKALGWCRFVNLIVKTGDFETFGANSQKAFYQVCAEVIGRQNLANLQINTGASLRLKLYGFPSDVDEQRKWIISGKYGNDNRKIVGKYPIINKITGEIYNLDIHQAIMFNAYMNVGDPRKEYKETLYDEIYVPLMNEFGEDPIALRTFNRHLANFASRMKTDLHRHGVDYYKKQLLTYIPGEDLTYAHSLFCGDGSGLIGYRYWKRVYNKEKKRWEEKLNVMNVYAMLVSDVASGYIAGYAFSPEGTHVETPEMVRGAVRMAVADGGNQTMFEFVSDNYSSFTKGGQKEFLQGVFNVVRTIEVNNSQGNPAETQFRLFKNSTLRRAKNFIRSSHNAVSIEGYANVEDMKAADYPAYSEAIAQVIEAINTWNNTPRGNEKTPAEMFQEKHPDCQPLTPIQVRNVFGHQTRVEVTRMRGFVKVEHAGVDHIFTIPDYHDSGIQKIAQATGYGYDAHVYVTWDANGADLYSSDGKYILTCMPTIKAGKSHAERTPEQLEAQRDLRHRKEAQLEAAQAFAEESLDALSTLASGNGYLADVRFNGGKEAINEMCEQDLSNRLTKAQREAKTKYQRGLVKQEAKERRAAERADREYEQGIRARALARKRAEIDISKYKQ